MRIAAFALLYASFMSSAVAAGNIPPESGEQDSAGNIKSRLEQISTFSLLKTDGDFSLHSKLTIPRFAAEEFAMHRNAPSYGLHGQFAATRRLGIKFGWGRYITGQDSGNNLYSLTAVIRF